MDQYIGKMLDNRYEILERIGTGGMAVVYKAKCHRLNRLVAVKILKSDLAQDADFRRRFNAESQAVAQLSHPNIVSVYDVSRGGDIEYIVMELIDGITLKQYMEKRGQLNWRESLHFITQIMRGLSHAHSRGIVHRDIKPQNIMVLRDGSVKVADFGIACLENSAQTLTQEALGSVHYISPEQARGDRTDARSDIYSAGVVLYEMLAGRLPFEGDSAVSVAIQHLSSIPLAPREINPDIPEQLELICMKAMASDMDRRYISADAMIADLEAFRKNPDVDLDFELSSLRPGAEEADEPTVLLRTGGHTATGSQWAVREEHHRERRRDYDDYESPRRGGSGKRTALIAAVSIAAVVLVFLLFRSIFSSFGAPVDYYEVPSLIGMTMEEALADPRVQDIFELVEAGSEPSEDYGVGEILRQDPKEGDTRKGDNRTIKVWISSGEDVAIMPDIATGDKTYVAAKAELKSLIDKYDLVFEEPAEDTWVFNEEVEAGKIISSEPAAGEPLKKGDTITVVISKGPQTVAYVSFEGLTLEKATEMLHAMGLDVGKVDEMRSDVIGKNVIISQNPDPMTTTEVPNGSKVDFVISSGPTDGDSGQGEWLPTGTDNLSLTLPTYKETGILKVWQDGTLLVNKEVDCRPGAYNLEISATGETHIIATLDGEEIYNDTITVDAYE